MRTNKSDVFVSLVTVIGPEHDSKVETSIREAINMLQNGYTNFELVIVDNGMSVDTRLKIVSILQVLPCIRVIRLPRKYDFDTAVFCGLETVIGDYTAVFEIGVDPIPEIPLAIEQLLQGVDVVQGLSAQSQGSYIRRLFRKTFFLFSRWIAGLQVPENSTYLIAFSRRALNAMIASPAGLKYLRHLVRQLGFEVFEVAYTRDSHDNFRNRPGLIQAIELVTNYSLRPLRILSWLGLIAALLNLFYALYVVIAFFSLPVERGWTTTNMQLSVMFFLLFISLAVMSEYLGRILSESRRGSNYIAMEELTSTHILADVDRRNIA